MEERGLHYSLRECSIDRADVGRQPVGRGGSRLGRPAEGASRPLQCCQKWSGGPQSEPGTPVLTGCDPFWVARRAIVPIIPLRANFSANSCR
jgi:hypothetical protein